MGRVRKSFVTNRGYLEAEKMAKISKNSVLKTRLAVNKHCFEESM